MSARHNRLVQDFFVKSLVGLPVDNELELFATICQKLEGLGDIIRQKDSDLFNEIVNYYTGTNMPEKTKLEIKKQKLVLTLEKN